MNNPPAILSNGAMFTIEGCASVANAAGSLLFYTDGMTVWNQSHQIMANGTGLFGTGSSSQSCLIVKQPGSATLYYIFTMQGVGGANGLNYSVVDISLASGQGSVTVKNASLYSAPCGEKLTGTKHCNGTDFWIVCREWPQNNNSPRNFRAYQLTSAGVNTVAVVSPSNFMFQNNYWYDYGCMKISPAGTKLGLANYNSWYNNQGASFELYDFNNSTGVISNSLALYTPTNQNYWNGGYGCEFSPDGTKFYGAHWGNYLNQNQMYQWNLCAGTPSAVVNSSVAIQTATGNIGSLQLAPDGKIYVARSSSQALGVIQSPNITGTLCNYVDAAQSVSPRLVLWGLPNFITSTFFQPPPLPPFTYTASNNLGCQTAVFAPPAVQNMTISNCSALGYSVTNYNWNFGDPASGPANTSSQMNPTHAFTNLGTYTVQLVVNYSCGGGTDTIRQAVIINQPCISVLSTSITCASLGSATVSATGGIGPFSYTWMPGNQTSSVATGLSPGTYTLTVFDFGNNFTYTATTVFTSLIPLTGNLAYSSSLACNGVNTGSATVSNIAGGSGSQNYWWSDGVNTYTNPIVTTLSAGVWSVAVTDATTGCMITNLFLITQPPPMSLSVSVNTPTVCVGGSVVLTGTNAGGIPGFTYSWTAGALNDSMIVAEASAGNFTYTLNSFDANNCLATNTISVDFIANPVLSVSNVSICPLQAGTLNVTGAVNYTWSTGSGNASISDNPLSNTVYTVTGEALSCVSTATAAILLKTTPVPLIGSNSPRCNGQTLQLFASGGNSYLWSGPASYTAAQQNPALGNAAPLNSGVYNLTVTAVNACTASASHTVLVHPTPTVAASASTVCVNQNLNLFAYGNNGSSFVWTGPDNFTSGIQNPSVNNPPLTLSGNYTVTIFGAGNCSNTAQTQASVVAMPPVSFTCNAPLCEAGTLSFTASGNGSILWNGPAGFASNIANPVIQNVAPSSGGVYHLSLTVGPCINTSSLFVLVHPLPNPSISGTSTACEGKSIHLAVITPPNQNILSWLWQGPAFSAATSAITFSSSTLAQSGMYQVKVTDNNNCSNTTSTSVYILPNPTVTVVSSTVCIFNSATLTAAGAAEYAWKGKGLLNDDAAAVVIGKASDVSTSIYTVTGTAANGCTAVTTASLSTLALPVPTIIVSPKTRVCMNQSVSLTGSGGNDYEWFGPNNIFLAGKTVSFTPASHFYAGTYTLMVTDENNCKGYTQVPIQLDELPTGSLLGSKHEACVPFCSDFGFYSASNSASVVTATWEINKKKFNSDFSYCFDKAGDHIVTGKFKDGNTGCLNTQTFVIHARPKPQADFTWLPEKPIENLDEVLFYNNTPGEHQTNWNWYFTDNKGYRSQNENTSYLFKNAGVYPVAYIVKNNFGCVDSVVKIVTIEPDFSVYVPNTFTPNDDDLNERFLPIVRGTKQYSFAIFNRWGEKLFETTDPKSGWDGYHNGVICKTDVYVWVIRLSTVHGEHKEYKGHVSLLR